MGSHGREPIVYSDTIRGKDGEPVTRRWEAYPGPFGFGGPSTHVMLYDLLQLYVEQECLGSQIQFGTLRSVFRRRCPDRHPGAADFRRMRRDLDVLCGYLFKCTNAFWDRARQAYVDMTWRLFDNVFYFKGRPDDLQQELPFGFMQVNRVLQEIARSRGFFALGFESRLFYGLRPIEGRLAIYLAKLFTSQTVHRRPVEDLARALPIESPRQEDIRRTLKSAADGLLAKGLRILKGYRLEKGSDGRWIAEFEQKERPKQDQPFPRQIREEISAEIEGLVHRIIGGDRKSARPELVDPVRDPPRAGERGPRARAAQGDVGYEGSQEPRSAPDEDLQGHREGAGVEFDEIEGYTLTNQGAGK